MKNLLLFISLILGMEALAQSNLNLNSGSEINVSNNWVIIVNGGITNNGNVTIESGSSLIQTHTGVDVNINNASYKVKREGSNSAMSYNIWSSPIKAATILATGSVFEGVNACDIFTFNGSTQEWKYDYPVNFSGNCAGNAVTFSSAYLLTDVTPDNVMDPTRGYYIPGNGTPERIFSGNVNNGDITTTVYSTTITTSNWSGTNWNLIGNPYPSAIDLASFWTLNTGVISDGIYFWNDPGTQTFSTCSDYVVWNPIGMASACGSSFNSSGVISSGQGFWVYATGSGTGSSTITFNNSLRTTANNTNFYKNKPDFERAWLSVSRNGRMTNQILLGLKNDATVGYDPQYDARKLPESSTFELAFQQDTSIYLILAQPTISYSEQEQLPLYLKTDSAGLHVFAFDSLKNVSGGNKYYLIDSDQRISHDLSTPYQVQLEAGEYKDRFYLLYTDVINGINEDVTNNNFVNVFHSNNEINVKSSKKDLESVTVYSTVGALVIAKNNISSPSVILPTGHLATGMYLVNYKLKNGLTETVKVIIP